MGRNSRNNNYSQTELHKIFFTGGYKMYTAASHSKEFVPKMLTKPFALTPLPAKNKIKGACVESMQATAVTQPGTRTTFLYKSEVEAVTVHFWRNLLDFYKLRTVPVSDIIKLCGPMDVEQLRAAFGLEELLSLIVSIANYIFPFTKYELEKDEFNRMRCLWETRHMSYENKRAKALRRGQPCMAELPITVIPEQPKPLPPPELDLEYLKGLSNKLCMATKKPMHFIGTEAELEELQRKLLRCKFFGFDLEYSMDRKHPATTLIQITTDDLEDYIIDPLSLWEHIYLLRAPFAAPHILKIGHAFVNDCLWLWQDFRIPVVSAFDTSFLLEQMYKLRGSGYGALLKIFLNLTINKSQQTSRWERRPLRPQQLEYAANDSHFLPMLALIEMRRIAEEGVEIPQLPPSQRYPFASLRLDGILMTITELTQSNQSRLILRLGAPKQKKTYDGTGKQGEK